jgi:acyl-CoA dehydrogenase
VQLTLPPEIRAFRDRVRRFLDDHLEDELRRDAARCAGVFQDYETSIRWHRILHRQGWVAPAWPEHYGGPGWDLMQRYVFASECNAAGAPALAPMGLGMCGPVLMGHGTDEQKAFYLPRILSGEDYWCQGYSEPGAGSDLASLSLRAERDGDHYILNGTKIWTTHAQHANRMFLLVRTSTEGRPQQGISFLLMDMDSPGVSVEPIAFSSGDHEVNTVFFEDVRVPVANRVGAENDGWTVAKYLLEFERGGGAAAPGLLESVADVRDQLARLPEAERLDAGRRLDVLEVRVRALEIAELQSLAETERTGSPGPGASMLKIQGSELSQAISEIAVEAVGVYGAPYQPEATTPGSNAEPIGPADGVTTLPFYLNNRAATIYAGSSEVQRNISSKAVLGL